MPESVILFASLNVPHLICATLTGLPHKMISGISGWNGKGKEGGLGRIYDLVSYWLGRHLMPMGGLFAES